MHSDAEHCLEYIFDLYSNTRHYAQTNASQNHFYLKFYNIVCVHYWRNVMMMINADDDVCHRPKILSVWEALVSCLIFSYWEHTWWCLINFNISNIVQVLRQWEDLGLKNYFQTCKGGSQFKNADSRCTF